jgi:CheY-like chemotaxis protein/HD-like signal output (HDOD) protein
VSTILVVDDMAIFRDPIAASLRLAGYLTLVAADGEEALEVARAKRPDLVLLDIAMPRMDGLTFLRHLRADPNLKATRVILLTAISEKQYVLKAAALGVGEYLLKSRFRLKDLLDRIAKQLNAPRPNPAEAPAAAAAAAPAAPAPEKAPAPAAAAAAGAGATTAAAIAAVGAQAAGKPAKASSPPAGPKPNIPRLLTRDDCVARAEGAFQAKTLSGVVMQVISMADSSRGDNTQLASLIARDPMLSVRVIQAANSAAYASNGRVVSTIPDAIRKVGCATVRNVAAALGVFDVMPESSGDGFNPIRCWQHSFAVAKLCEHLAGGGDLAEPGLAYVVGLCHDLAEIFIHGQFASEYQQVIDMAERTGLPRAQLEQEMMGMTHGELVGTIFRCLALPDTIRDPVQILHNPNPERTTNPLGRILWLAENYANGAMLASSPASMIAPLSQALCRSATGQPDPAPPDAAALRSEVMCLTAMLARLPGGESKLLAPPFARRPVRVWLTRDTTLSAFDPVEMALQSLADVEVHDRLPGAAELDEVQGCVVVMRAGEVPAISAARIEQMIADAEGRGRPRPVYWISGSRLQAAGPKSPAPVQAPLELSDLAAFIETLVPAAKPAAAA